MVTAWQRAIFGRGQDLCFGKTGARRGSAMVLFNKALVSSYIGCQQ